MQYPQTFGRNSRVIANLANINDITAFRHPKFFGREGSFFLQEWVEGRLLGECVEVKAEPGEGGRMAIEKLVRPPAYHAVE
jgi:hypothetical protein